MRGNWPICSRELRGNKRGGVGELFCRRFVSSDEMAAFLLWCLLFVVCWPIALLALILYPFAWLLLLPFRILGVAVGGVLAFLTALLFLPARVLGLRTY